MSDAQNNRGKGQQVWKIQRMKTSPALPLSLLQVQWKNIIFFRWRPILRKIREKRNNNSKQFKKSTKTKTNKQKNRSNNAKKNLQDFTSWFYARKHNFAILGTFLSPEYHFASKTFGLIGPFKMKKWFSCPKQTPRWRGRLGPGPAWPSQFPLENDHFWSPTLQLTREGGGEIILTTPKPPTPLPRGRKCLSPTPPRYHPPGRGMRPSIKRHIPGIRRNTNLLWSLRVHTKPQYITSFNYPAHGGNHQTRPFYPCVISGGY